jgi:hypothetical protein
VSRHLVVVGYSTTLPVSVQQAEKALAQFGITPNVLLIEIHFRNQGV